MIVFSLISTKTSLSLKEISFWKIIKSKITNNVYFIDLLSKLVMCNSSKLFWSSAFFRQNFSRKSQLLSPLFFWFLWSSWIISPSFASVIWSLFSWHKLQVVKISSTWPTFNHSSSSFWKHTWDGVVENI